jgi:hypothetical protein
VRHHQIVVMFRCGPRSEILMKETNALCPVGPFTFKTLPRQLQHKLARVDAINLDSRMDPKKFTQKSSIPLAYDQGAPRRGDLAETRDPRTLEVIAKGNPL